MGFYSPATIVEDAKRHGVVVRPVDVLRSDWDCTLEETQRRRPALRMGLRHVKGLGAEDGKRIEAARRRSSFLHIADFAARTGVDEGDLLAVRSAGAYGFAMSSNYNGRPRAAEVLVRGDRYAVVRERETLEDMIRGESIPEDLLS